MVFSDRDEHQGSKCCVPHSKRIAKSVRRYNNEAGHVFLFVFVFISCVTIYNAGGACRGDYFEIRGGLELSPESHPNYDVFTLVG